MLFLPRILHPSQVWKLSCLIASNLKSYHRLTRSFLGHQGGRGHIHISHPQCSYYNKCAILTRISQQKSYHWSRSGPLLSLFLSLVKQRTVNWWRKQVLNIADSFGLTSTSTKNFSMHLHFDLHTQLLPSCQVVLNMALRYCLCSLPYCKLPHSSRLHDIPPHSLLESILWWPSTCAKSKQMLFHFIQNAICATLTNCCNLFFSIVLMP